jgi:hypothetical protein
MGACVFCILINPHDTAIVESLFFESVVARAKARARASTRSLPRIDVGSAAMVKVTIPDVPTRAYRIMCDQSGYIIKSTPDRIMEEVARLGLIVRLVDVFNLHA